MNTAKIKLKHFIATHTFNSDKAKKEYMKFVKHRKRNVEWFENVPKRDDAKLYQLFIGKADFFFCHWFAESENAIIETLSQAGADEFMITMAIEISTPKMDLEKMKSLIETIK